MCTQLIWEASEDVAAALHERGHQALPQAWQRCDRGIPNRTIGTIVADGANTLDWTARTGRLRVFRGGVLLTRPW